MPRAGAFETRMVPLDSGAEWGVAWWHRIPARANPPHRCGMTPAMGEIPSPPPERFNLGLAARDLKGGIN